MSLINDALKRAAEAQGQPPAQAPTRPRGPKGVEDLPVPMTPVAARERPAWVPVAGIGLLIVVLLGASGFFFAKWWKERKAWQPYATEDIDEDGMPRTNLVAKADPPKPATPTTAKVPVTPAPTVTNLPATTNVAVVPPTLSPEPPKTNAPPAAAVTPTPVTPPTAVPPVAPTPTNLVNQPSPPPQPPTPAPPPKVEPVKVASTNTTPPPSPPPTAPPETAKKGDDHVTKVASIEFPELKLQGISRRKNKTFAVLNGKTLSAGDRIEGVLLLKIDTDSVIVEKGGARRELFLLR